MAQNEKEAKEPTAAQIEKAYGPPTPAVIRAAAEDLPERDDVEKAHKAALLADTPQEEVKEKVKIVKASPDSPDTPSGGALLAVAGISDPTERGEEYARQKAARRAGIDLS